MKPRPHTQGVDRDERIRLMGFVTLFGLGSSERQFVKIGLELDSQRFALEYGCTRRWANELDEVTRRRVEVSEFPIRRLFGPGALLQQFRLARRIGRRGIQILHSHNAYSNIFAIPAAWLAGTPVIIASMREPVLNLTPVQRFAQRAICGLADCILVHRESIREQLVADGYDASRIALIPGGWDQPAMASGRRPDLLEELGYPGVHLVAMMAKMEPNEGIEDFIDAAAIVSWTRPDARFLIVGTSTKDAEYRQAIADRIQRLGLRDTVRLIADHLDVGELIQHLTISVLPSCRQNSLDVLRSAMAAGVPVVATRVEGTRDVVEHEQSGLLVPPADPQELAEAIGRVLQGPAWAARLGAAGRQAVRDRFSTERMLHATEQLYLDLLVQKARRPDWRTRIGLARHAFERLPGKRKGAPA